MRRLACVVGCSLCIPVLASADPFEDFRIPPHAVRSGRIELSATGRWLDGSTSTYGASDNSMQNSRFALSSYYLWDSDPLRYGFGATFDGSASRNRAGATQYGVIASENNIRGENFTEGWSIGGDVRVYPWEMPLGLELAVTGRGTYGQNWSRQEDVTSDATPPGSRSERLGSNEVHRHDHEFRMSAATSYGRVRNANVVYDVHVLEERLRATGALAQPLSNETRTKLAELFYVRNGYTAAHERPNRYFWDDVEKVLQEDAALTSRGLDPYSLMRVQEPYGPFQLRGLGFARESGWLIGPVVEARHARSVQKQASAGEQRTYVADSLVTVSASRSDDELIQDTDQFRLGGKAEYHRSLGWNWQLDLDSRVTWPLRPGESGLEATTNAGAHWIIADRWEAGFIGRHWRSLFEPRHATDVSRDAWAVSFTAGLSYYLEDRTELFVQVDQRQTKSAQDSSMFTRDTQMRLGMSYRFLGAFDAPGLVEPQRLMH